MPVDLGVHWIAPLLPSFVREYPGIDLEVDLTARYADPIGEGVDVALRLGTVRGEQLIVRKIGAIEQALFAAPSYFEHQRARPRSPVDLIEHDGMPISNKRGAVRWRLARIGSPSDVIEATVHGRITLNNVGLMRVSPPRYAHSWSSSRRGCRAP